MNIGILTFFRANYGAILQACAMQTVLASLGHSSEIIDYNSVHQRTESLFDSWASAKDVVLNFFTVLRYRLIVERKRRIAEFHNRNMHISVKKYFSSSELATCISEYDAFICGSDQVWKPNTNHDRNSAYFLGFVKQDQAIKISYAPSFGVSSLPQAYHAEMKVWINDIPNLSVREETGKAIIQQIAGRQATVVLDPTLLLEKEQWDSAAIPPTIKTPYLLVYATSQRGLLPELVKHIKRLTRLPVVVLSLTSLNLVPLADHVIYAAGPSEFIGLFANATCVCTNSFHGTAFSMIYRKPFWSVPHNITNSRIADLLHRIELADRQVIDPEHFPKSPLEIDYTAPVSRLDKERKQSIDFLKSALQRPLT